MSEIRNLTRNGETFYPLTTSSAVINESTGEGYVIDEYPTEGSHNLIESGGVYSSIHRRLVKLVGMAEGATAAGVSQKGDIYYNTNSKKLFECIIWYQVPSSSTYEEVPFYDGAIYTFDDKLWIWDGTDLCESTKELKEIIEQMSQKLYVTESNSSSIYGTLYDNCFIDTYGNWRENVSGYKILKVDVTDKEGYITIPFDYYKWNNLGYVFVNNLGTIISHGNLLDTERFNIPENAVFFEVTVKGNETRTDVLYTKLNIVPVNEYFFEIESRKRMDIYLADSQEDIVDKLFYARDVGNYNVYWEHGTYNFTTAFDYIHTNYNGLNNNELPLGGNCRYYFNNSTIIGTKTTEDTQVAENESLFGVLRRSDSFEIHDATLIANDLVYVVHDDAAGKSGHYKHIYSNIKFVYNTINSTNNIRKCIGGGMGVSGNIIIENCYFSSDHSAVLEWHRNTSNSNPSSIDIKIINSYLIKGVTMDDLDSNNTGSITINGSGFKQNNVGTISSDWNSLLCGNSFNIT